ncbi:MAG: hypothetical protein QOH60_1042 [Mycobacterium sp.]|jgi:FtsZ-interacting cell division protein ZipA|nr:hypothetical protein [Mycobacterium sp.]
MAVWGWFFIVALVAVAALAVVLVWASMRRRKSRTLKERFGPEYDHTVSEVGEQRAAEKELVARQRERSKLDIIELTPEARERYATQWRDVQAAFVDHPDSAVSEADRLVSEVMRERGYPVDDFDRRASDISVDHPDVVANYRSAHQIYEAQGNGATGTEDQREAFVHYRALFEKLLGHDEDVKAQDVKAQDVTPEDVKAENARTDSKETLA